MMGKGCETTFWGDGHVLALDTTVGYVSVISCQNSLNYTLKMCNCTECKLYNKSYCTTSQNL